MVWLLFGAAILLLAIREVGIVSALCYLAVIYVVISIYTKIRTKAQKEHASKTLKSIANALPSIIKTMSIVLMIIGILAFIIGFATSSDSVTFNGSRCSACGGDGWFMSKECPSCKGTGYEFGRKSVFWNGTWSGVMLAVSAGIVFIITYGDGNVDKNLKESITSEKQRDTSKITNVNIGEEKSNNDSEYNCADVQCKTVLIGRVINGRYSGLNVQKSLNKNVLFIELEDSSMIALSKNNVFSIDDVSDHKYSEDDKKLMIIWNDFETSIIQIKRV